MQKLTVLEPLVGAVFYGGKIIYCLGKSGRLFTFDVQKQTSVHIANTTITNPTSICISLSVLLITSVRDSTVLSFEIKNDHYATDVSLTLANHTLSEISIVSGHLLNVVAIYQNNRFSVFLYGPGGESKEWRLNQYSK
jgi:hypothetical protein